jgi:5-dehydro-4-deoxyglucarate dehydratase
MELSKIKSALEDGLLSFPVTDFDEKGSFSADSFANRVDWFVNNDVSSLFVAGGTGEFFSLSAAEYEKIIKVQV